MPFSYQVTEHTRRYMLFNDAVVTREMMGFVVVVFEKHSMFYTDVFLKNVFRGPEIDDDRVVFCNFNQAVKMTPTVSV
jgi:hypothetical protein